MDAVMIDAMIVEAVRQERERIKGRIQAYFDRCPWISDGTQRAVLDCVEEG